MTPLGLTLRALMTILVLGFAVAMAGVINMWNRIETTGLWMCTIAIVAVTLVVVWSAK